MLTAFKDNPFKFQLRDEYETGTRPRPIPTVKPTYYHGKPATRRILEHFDEDFRRLLAFQTHEGVFAWDRLTMGAQPSSSVQQGPYHDALNKYIPSEYRHRYALMADDIAAGADTLEELFELYKIFRLSCTDKRRSA